MAAPKIKSRRRNECLDLGSENATVSRGLLFATLQRAIKQALIDGRSLTPNLPDEALEANARGRASVFVDELLHKGGRPAGGDQPANPVLGGKP